MSNTTFAAPVIPEIGLNRPDLSKLPNQMVERILDMWRAGSILERYPDQSIAYKKLQHEYECCEKYAVNLIMSVQLPADHRPPQSSTEGLATLRQIRHGVPEMPLPSEIFEINHWVSASTAECMRLSYEMQIAYFHMAIDTQPAEKNKIRTRFPLIDCAMKLRNVVVHYRPVKISQGDFLAKIANHIQADGSALRMHFKSTWYFDVLGSDLDKTQGPNDPRITQWFESQTKNYPAWYLMQCCVEQLCQYYK